MPEIVLNEKAWVEETLNSLTLGTKPSETLGRLARYYYAAGYRKSEITRMLEEFMIRCDPMINIVKWQKLIDDRVKNADKYGLINIQEIVITEKEMEKVQALPGILLQRLMFTLLCLARYGNAVNPRNNGWVNREVREIFSLANVAVTIKRQSLLFNDLWMRDYIGYSHIVDNINVTVKIIDESEAAVALRINDFRNLGNQYMMFVSAGYMKCKNCGTIVKMNSPRQKYCKECAVDMNIQRTIHNRTAVVA